MLALAAEYKQYPAKSVVPSANNKTIALDGLRERLQGVKKPEYASLFKVCPAGKPFASKGARDATCYAIVKAIAYLAPSTTEDAIVELFGPSLCRYDGTGNPTKPSLRRLFVRRQRACSRRRERQGRRPSSAVTRSSFRRHSSLNSSSVEKSSSTEGSSTSTVARLASFCPSRTSSSHRRCRISRGSQLSRRRGRRAGSAVREQPDGNGTIALAEAES